MNHDELTNKRVHAIARARDCTIDDVPAWVHTDATVVISLITTLGGGIAPTTVKSAMLGLFPLPALAAASTARGHQEREQSRGRRSRAKMRLRCAVLEIEGFQPSSPWSHSGRLRQSHLATLDCANLKPQLK
jgi:hypothetical protein